VGGRHGEKTQADGKVYKLELSFDETPKKLPLVQT